jgi:hypothetical protein
MEGFGAGAGFSVASPKPMNWPHSQMPATIAAIVQPLILFLLGPGLRLM